MSDAHERQVDGDHYKNLPIEPWKAMKAWFTPEEWTGFLKGNMVKYLARANSGKGSSEVNLLKACHYAQALEEHLLASQVQTALAKDSNEQTLTSS